MNFRPEQSSIKNSQWMIMLMASSTMLKLIGCVHSYRAIIVAILRENVKNKHLAIARKPICSNG